MGAIARTKRGRDKTALTQKRRVMSLSSASSSPPSADATMGSRAMPHFGQLPGPSWTISGCMGQVYFPLPRGCPPSGTLPESCWTGSPPPGSAWVYFSGSDRNFVAQWGLQKCQVRPPCSALSAAESGSTFIPQTGSTLMGATPRVPRPPLESVSGRLRLMCEPCMSGSSFRAIDKNGPDHSRKLTIIENPRSGLDAVVPWV